MQFIFFWWTVPGILSWNNSRSGLRSIFVLLFCFAFYIHLIIYDCYSSCVPALLLNKEQNIHRNKGRFADILPGTDFIVWFIYFRDRVSLCYSPGSIDQADLELAEISLSLPQWCFLWPCLFHFAQTWRFALCILALGELTGNSNANIVSSYPEQGAHVQGDASHRDFVLDTKCTGYFFLIENLKEKET